MKILVTGASGFIGNALCLKILDQGWQVRGVFRQKNEKSNVQKNVQPFYVNSIDSSTKWSDALSGVDAVIHLAARVHIMNDTNGEALAEYRKTNTAGTRQLAYSAAQAGVKRFIFMSTIKVNGEGRDEPYSSRDTPSPIDPYAVSKWEAEKELRNICKKYNLNTVILRPPLVYGPGVRANFLSLFKIVDKGIPLPLANVNNLRSLIFLDNLIDAIITCITHPKASEQTFLVSDQEDVATPELIRKIASSLGKQARLFRFPLSLLRLTGKPIGKSDAIDRLLGTLRVDSTGIQEVLDWKPPYSLQQGLSQTADWYLHAYKK